MDDPISALDAHVRKDIFTQVIDGICKEKTRILVTHSTDFLHLCDKIVLMADGRIVAQGTFKELAENDHMKSIANFHIKSEKKKE